MTSLRTRLFVILVSATGVIWLCAVAWIYVSSRTELEHVLDTRLQEAARMVNSLVTSSNMSAAAAIDASPVSSVEPAGYERQLSCQIWSLDGRLVARSSGAPDATLADSREGFSDRIVDGETWRVYSVTNEAHGVRVMVGDRLGLRDRLVADLIKGLMTPALLIVPLLGLLIWVSLGRGLAPLTRMAGDLRDRSADNMSPIDSANVPREVKPLAEALNSLFASVERARRHERDVTAFAAHELRTPLAGLKTQAQIAMATADPDVRSNALALILVSVDRSTRLVRQLLSLARLDNLATLDCDDDIRVGPLLDDIRSEVLRGEDIPRVEIDPALNEMRLRSNRNLLTSALRNLLENAVQHTPAGGTISCCRTSDGLSIEDDGPGIPEHELSLVRQRFYRGPSRGAAGTGLGLAIVEAALNRLDATLVLTKRQPHGLKASIHFSMLLNSNGEQLMSKFSF